jgi:hypothetical protein
MDLNLELMQITKRSPLTGKETTLDLDITQSQLIQWQNGALIQNVMPHLTPDEREFLISGMAPGEFDTMFNEEIEE